MNEYVETQIKSYAINSTIKVDFGNGPGNAKDWVGLYLIGAVEGSGLSRAVDWLYVDNTKGGNTPGIEYGTLIFTKGCQDIDTYEYRFFENDGYTRLATSKKFETTVLPTPTGMKHIFPLIPQMTFVESKSRSILISNRGAGAEQRRDKNAPTMRTFKFTMGVVDESDMLRLWNFYKARHGAVESFLFKNPNDHEIEDESLGMNSTQYYLSNIPVSPSSVDVYIGGVHTDTLGLNYTVDYNVGKILFDVETPNDEAVTANYNYLTKVRFSDKQITRSMFEYKIYSAGVELDEVV